MIRIVRTAAPAIAVLVSAGAAAGQATVWRLCTSPEAAADLVRAIAACSRLVSSRETGERAAAFLTRGTLHLRKGDADRAIADFDAALRLHPGNVVAFNHRGEAYSRKGDFRRALADYGEAVRLNPRYPQAFRNRARIHFYRGDFAAAAEDFRIAEQIDRTSAYSLLWRYVAEARSGIVDRAGLYSGNAHLREGWPRPLVLHYLGHIGEGDVLTSAAADPHRRPEQECEARFFLGQKHIIDGARERAAAELRRAVANCPRYMVEYRAARVELLRIGLNSP